MNVEFIQKWIDALRSGEYEQGTHCLRRDNHFCCIGVLCDLYQKEFPDDYKWFEDYSQKYKFSNGENAVLNNAPIKVLNHATISRSIESELISRNDNGLSFGEIASIIEEKLCAAISQKNG